jgi:PAS domain S-box-containing protein
VGTTAGAAEHELERLREMFQQAPGAMAILRGATHVIEMANAAYLELVGERDVVGRPVAEAMPELAEQGFITLLERVFDSGEAHVGKAVPVALRRGRSGALEERVLDFVYQPLTNSAGRVTGIFVEAADVTDRVRAEAALRQSEERYRYAFDTAAVSLWEEDCTDLVALIDRLRAEGVRDFRAHFERHPELVREAVELVRVREVNQEAVRAFGARTKDELKASLGRTFTESSFDVFKEELVALAEGRTSFAAETELCTLDGTPRRFHVASKFPTSNEALDRVLITLVDITARARTEQALRDSEERYRAFVANSSEAIWRYELAEQLDVSLPPDEQIEHVYRHARLAELNDAMARMYGLERAEQLIGARIEDTLPRSDPASLAFLRRLVESGFAVRDMDSTEKNAAGETRRFANTMIPVFEGGKLVRVWGVQRDITERTRTQEALTASEDRLRSMFAQTLSGIAETDLQGRFLRVNPRYCEITGRSEAELLALKMQDITHPEDLPRNLEHFAALVRSESLGFQIEKRYVRPDDSVVWVHNSVALVRDAHGRPQSTVAIALDISASRAIEEALRQSDTRFRRLIETAPIGIAISEPNGAVLRANDALLEILGYGREDLDRGTVDWQRFTPPEYLSRDLEHMAALRRGESPPPFEKELIRRDGSRVSVLIVARFLPGEGERMVAYALDITARKRAEAALRTTERRLSRLFETNLLGVLYFDLEGGVQEANDEFLRIVGFERADLADGLIDWARMTPQELKAQDARAVAELRRAGSHVPIEKQYVRKDGSRVSVLVGSAMIEGDNGVGFVLDLTASKRAEAAVRESEARLRSVIDNMTGFVAMLDCDGTLLEVGEPALRVGGLRREDVIGCKFWECGWWLHDPDQQRRIEQWVAAAAQGATIREDVTARIAGDGRLTVDFMLAPVKAPDGSVTHVIPSGIDISFRKRMEMALREAAYALRDADRRKDEFLATLAHELRNPLAPIRNAVQLLKLAPEAAAQARDIIERQVQHMVRLVDDLLDVSRITLGQVNLKREELTLGAVLSEALDAARPAIEAAGHSLHVDLPGEPLLLEGDATRLSQVFQNLLDNATKYTPRGGGISVSVQRHGAEAIVSVRDTGVGIPSEMQGRIFELFTRSHPEGDVKIAGLGVGLALSRQLVELHGGRMHVASEGAGRGATFSVHLPLLAAGAAATPAEGQPKPPAGSSDRRILVVDDNRDAASSLAMLLELSGCSVSVAFSGPQALEMFEHVEPDTVVLDIGMPGMDGYEVARRLRADARGRDVLLVALTGWGQEEDKRRAIAAGFDEHLTKPVDPAHLSALLRARADSSAPAPRRPA